MVRDRRSTIVGIPTKRTERKIAGSFVIAAVRAAQRKTEKLVFAVPPPQPPQQLWSPIYTVGSDEWTKETLCS